jgi:Ca2+-binding RTX toxin-like protein
MMIQPLEPRALLSFNVESNVLVVRGTRASETLSLGWTQNNANDWTLVANDGKSTQTFSWSSTATWNAVSVYGGNGADTLRAALLAPGVGTSQTPPVSVSLNSGAGNDVVIGSENPDTILGGSGYDSILAGAGNDSVNGEGGKDTIVCGAGNDTALGDSGRDKILGEDGDDRLFGGANADQIDGGEDDDQIEGNGGLDALFAGSTANGPFFRGANTDNDFDTIWGSAANEPNEWGDEVFL